VVHPSGIAKEIPYRVEVNVSDSGGGVGTGLAVGRGLGVGLGSEDAEGDALSAGAPPTGADDDPGLRNQTPRAPTATTTTAAAASLA
jgi:hypothetical protein